MIPRGRLDIGWSDLLAGAVLCFSPGGRDAAQRRVEERWSPDGDALACLSIRSGLDLLLTALGYPKGSEILVSAITIRDMVRVVEHHGLVAVPVDLDMTTLAVRTDSLQRALSPRTKAVLVAHLFGSRMPLDAVAAFTRAHGLLLIEDCAQSFTGPDYTGDAASDVTMFSFGPIKTSTALGGALFRVRDGLLRARMRAVQSAHPVQGRWRFFQRVLRFFTVRLLMQRRPYTVLCALCRVLGKNHDELISHSVRGFSGPDFFANIRHQPSYPLLALLHRRLTRFDGVRVARRTAAADTVLGIAPGLPRPGREAAFHSYWTFPAQSNTPDELVRGLWLRGFDATRGAWSLYCLPAPPTGSHLEATGAREAMQRVVYLPVYPEVPRRELERLARMLELELAGGGVCAAAPGATARAGR
jgi:dTDP-4-amino-4,6-dideoxygalactose transaminase